MTRTRKPSAQTSAVLRALATEPAVWRHGYDLSRNTSLKAGTLYPILMRLEDRGQLEARWEDNPEPGRPARHLYRLTPAGLTAAAEVGPETAPAVLRAQPRPQPGVS